MKAMALRVLMILHHFPPSQAMSAMRARRLIRHLPDLGIEPLVVTGMATEESRDESGSMETMDDKPVFVIRVRGGWDPVQRRPRDARGSRRSGPGRAKKWKRLVRSFLVPDELFRWVGAWVRGGLAAAAGGVDLVYSTSTPFSAHLAGQRLAKRLGKPWVMEMRDLWADSPYLPQAKNPLTRRLQERYESRCLETSRRVIVTTEAHARHLLERKPSLAGRIDIVPNAFEPSATSALGRRKGAGEGPLRILHSGNLYGGRSLAALGRAVDETRGAIPGFGSAILEVAGRSLDLPWEDVLGGSGDRRVIHGFLPSDRITELYEEVHAGIVHNPAWDMVHIPGKLHEYMGAGLPILDLTSQPEIPSLCHGTIPCWKVSPDDREGLGDALSRLARWWGDNPLGPPKPGPLHSLSSVNVARKLAAVFRESAS